MCVGNDLTVDVRTSGGDDGLRRPSKQLTERASEQLPSPASLDPRQASRLCRSPLVESTRSGAHSTRGDLASIPGFDLRQLYSTTARVQTAPQPLRANRLARVRARRSQTAPSSFEALHVPQNCFRCSARPVCKHFRAPKIANPSASSSQNRQTLQVSNSTLCLETRPVAITEWELTTLSPESPHMNALLRIHLEHSNRRFKHRVQPLPAS